MQTRSIDSSEWVPYFVCKLCPNVAHTILSPPSTGRARHTMRECTLQAIYVRGVVKSRSTAVLRSTISRCKLSSHSTKLVRSIIYSRVCSRLVSSPGLPLWRRVCGSAALRSRVEALAVVAVALEAGVPPADALLALENVRHTSPCFTQQCA